ncbi:hypothetical protein D3C75_888060 [compost metagenome]
MVGITVKPKRLSVMMLNSTMLFVTHSMYGLTQVQRTMQYCVNVQNCKTLLIYILKVLTNIVVGSSLHCSRRLRSINAHLIKPCLRMVLPWMKKVVNYRNHWVTLSHLKTSSSS